MAVFLESGISVYHIAVDMAMAVQALEVAKNIRVRMSAPHQIAVLLDTHCIVCYIFLWNVRKLIIILGTCNSMSI